MHAEGFKVVYIHMYEVARVTVLMHNVGLLMYTLPGHTWAWAVWATICLM